MVTTPSEHNETEEQCDYVVNTNTKKFHLPSCSSVKDIKTKNR
jgi:DNA-entry nuclease